MISNSEIKKPFIVPLVFGLTDYDAKFPQYSWVFEVYMNFSFRNDYPIIAQENYFKQRIKNLNKYYYPKETSSDENLLNQTKNLYRKYSIKNVETENIISSNKNRFEAESSLLQTINPEYKKIIENRLNKIEKDFEKKIDALIIWVWNPTLEAIAQERGIRLISEELSPIRDVRWNNNYNTTLCYFQFSNKYDKNYCKKLYSDFLKAISNENIQLLSRDELLSMFLNTEDLNLLKIRKNQPKYELGVDPRFKNDFFFETYRKEDFSTTCKKIEKLFDSKKVSIRFPPNLEYQIGNPDWEKDSSTKSIYWVTMCRRILSSVSNISFDAMMFGKTSYILSENMPFSFKSLQDLEFIDESVVEATYLNFMLFGYFSHWDLIFDPEYIGWRLTNPDIIEIYKYNKSYILELIGIDCKIKHLTQEHILKEVHNLSKTDIQRICQYSPYEETLKLDSKISKLTDDISENNKKIKSLSAMLVSKLLLTNNLKNNLEEKQKETNSLVEKVNEVNQLLIVKNNLLKNIYESPIYRFLGFVRKNPNPLSSLKISENQLVRSLNYLSKETMKKTLYVSRIFLKSLYKLYPIKKHKRLLRNKVYSSSRLPILLGVKKFSDYKSLSTQVILEDGNSNSTIDITPLTHLNKTLAVHLHLYYEDLLEEFFNYLSNIPFVFDLYVSVNDKANIKRIKRKFKKIINVDKVFVEISKNKGRDFGPMFVLFRERLKNYDYLYHIHSKKSLRTGQDNSEWRHHLLNAILGSKEQIMYCFELMENHNVSQIFADTYKDIPLWANTWLGEIPLARNLYRNSGAKISDSYLSFSAGSMFVVKTKAIDFLMKRRWSWDDFEEEKGQDRGTVAYAFERGITNLLTGLCHNFSVFDIKTNTFIINRTNKNIDEYSLKTRDSTLEYLSKFDIISFDIFDTLITRNIYYPDDAFRLIEEKVSKLGVLKKRSFFSLRKKSEENIRKKKKFLNDCTIDEIYIEFEKLSKLKRSDVNKIKQLEINTELELAIPRRDMLSIFNSLLEMKKIILLVSDMYLTEKYIRKILTKCGYENYYDLLVSSEIGLRKDNGTMYEYLFKKYDSDSIIHVGDNESSDIHNLVRMEKPTYYVGQGRKLFEISNYNLNFKTPLSLDDSLIWGAIINNNLFNSPFALNKNDERSLIKGLYSYGYSILGPIFLYFFIWLLNNVKGNEALLFISREGYYLQKIYNQIVQRIDNSKLNKIKNIYFLGSRRALTVANIQNLSDIEEIMKKNYDIGTLYELFYYRLGVEISPEQDKVISLPEEFNLVMNLAEEYFPQIKNNALKERENYIKYINSVLPPEKTLSIVDLGYSGTAQFELSKLINKKIGGYYFCVSKNKKPLSIGLPMDSCFNNSIYGKNLESNILYKYSLLIESFLTAPEGQLIRFIENKKSNTVIPEFITNLTNVDKEMNNHKLIYSGISDFINNIIDLKGKDFLEMKLSKNYILKNFENFIDEAEKWDDIFEEITKVEDLYCGESKRNAKDICINNKNL